MAEKTYSVDTIVSYIEALIGHARGQSPGQTASPTGDTAFMPSDGSAAKTATTGSTAYPAGYKFTGQSGSSDFDTFYQALLAKLGMPATPANMAFMRAWNQAEGMQTSTNNPFATTQEASGASNINSVGVKSYTSFDQGVQATAETLQNGMYDNVLEALRAGTDPMAGAVAVANSHWGTGSLVIGVLQGGGGGGTGGESASAAAAPEPPPVDQATQDYTEQAIRGY